VIARPQGLAAVASRGMLQDATRPWHGVTQPGIGRGGMLPALTVPVERDAKPEPSAAVARGNAAGQASPPPWRTSAASMMEKRSGAFRVLLAEDDAEMRSVVADALRGDGYEVVEAADGGRLLVDVAAWFKGGDGADSVDLIVSDIRMPICTGLQILAALRDAHWRTPVILMTAFGDETVRRHAESLDALLFDKPFDLDDLRTAVANLLPRERPPR